MVHAQSAATFELPLTDQVRGMLRKAGHCPIPMDAEIKNISSFIAFSTWTCRV